MSKKVNSKHKKAIRLLLAGTSKSDTAVACGVQRETISRWFCDSAFKAELRCAQDAVLLETVSRLVSGDSQAIDTIETIIKDETIPASVRLRAATVWLDQQHKAIDRDMLLDRIGQLEQIAKDDKDDNK